MSRSHIVVALLLLAPLAGFAAGQGRKPAPPASRWGYTLVIDEKSLPKGVTIRTLKDELGTRHFIKNTSDVPLVVSAVYQNEKLVGGSKLVGGKVYGYFPSGVPMEGKQHQTGWQAPFGDIERNAVRPTARTRKDLRRPRARPRQNFAARRADRHRGGVRRQAV